MILEKQKSRKYKTRMPISENTNIFPSLSVIIHNMDMTLITTMVEINHTHQFRTLFIPIIFKIYK